MRERLIVRPVRYEGIHPPNLGFIHLITKLHSIAMMTERITGLYYSVKGNIIETGGTITLDTPQDTRIPIFKIIVPGHT